MKKLIRNIINLISIDTPYFIIINYIKNYFPNYRKKKECLKIEKNIYSNFKSEDISKKWFTNNLYFIKKNLANTKIKYLLEIGSYEGRSALFFLDLFKITKISCVDTWSGSDEHKDINFHAIENNFDLNTKSFKEKKTLLKFKMTSDEFFKQNKNKFDFIYVDGDHAKDQVYKDLINSWSILNSNGFLLIDDYMWWYFKDLKKNPASAVNSFINKYFDQVRKIVIWHQVLLQKK